MYEGWGVLGKYTASEIYVSDKMSPLYDILAEYICKNNIGICI